MWKIELNWTSVNDASRLPTIGKPLLCKCPLWNDVGFQVATWDGTEFSYEDQPNGNFSQCVEAWVEIE